MRRLIVHVGPHKTGSTSIQGALFFAAKELFKVGIYYPTEWISPDKQSHYSLFEQLRGNKVELVKNTAERVLRTNANTIVISAEDLSLLKIEELNVLSQAFRSVDPNLNISIVFYVRGWSGLFPSVVQELIKHGIVLTLSDVLAQEILSPERSDTINYVNRLDRFAAIFGTDSINIIAYDNIVDSKQSLVDHFFRNILNCAWNRSDAYNIDTQHNNSLSITEVEFLRLRNCLVNNGSIHKFAGDANEYLLRLRASNFQDLADAMKAHVREVEIDETASPFKTLYDTLHTKYYSRFLNPDSSSISDPLFRRVRRNVKYIHPNYLCDFRVLNSMIILNQNIMTNRGE
jgi:hypothetical protein